MFSEGIQEAVEFLVNRYKSTRRTIQADYPIIEICYLQKDRKITFSLFYLEDNYLEIQVPTYHYYPKISHYDFKRKEKRWVRNKYYLFTFITDLKLSGLWGYVRNKDFIVVNENNENLNVDKATIRLNEILKDVQRDG